MMSPIINNLYLSPLSHEAWLRIIRCSGEWRQEHDSSHGFHYWVAYRNGYGASIVKNPHGSFGCKEDLWELAILRYSPNGEYSGFADGDADPLGWLTEEEVVRKCDEIFNM